MTKCLVCPSWGPCKCADGPKIALPPAVIGGPASSPVIRPSAPVRKISHAGARQKGAQGEREIYKALNYILFTCMKAEGFSEAMCNKAFTCIQRNQNQSAVGGNDLSHTFGMSIEVKRQEALSINTWWAQTVKAALPNKELPVLVYRQNHGSWHVVTTGSLFLPPLDGSLYGTFNCRVQISWDDFQGWFKSWVTRKLKAGELPHGISE